MASRKIRALAVVSALVALGLAACTSSAGDPRSTDKPSPDASSPPPPSTPTESEPTAEGQAIAAWESFHTERLRQLTSRDDPDPARFEDLATESATEAVIDLIFTGRGDVPFIITDTEFWPEAEVAAGQDRATVSDCIVIAERAASQTDAELTVRSQLWTGSLVATDSGWRVDQITPDTNDCLPAELNQELLDAYRAWNDAKNQWWGSPDPDHPLLEEVMTGAGLEGMRERLAEHRAMGIVIRDTHDPMEHAVVDRLGIGTAWITDCYPAESGGLVAYDQGTGERRDDLTPPPQPGQRDRMVVNLERTERWVEGRGMALGTERKLRAWGDPYVVP